MFLMFSSLVVAQATVEIKGLVICFGGGDMPAPGESFNFSIHVKNSANSHLFIVQCIAKGRAAKELYRRAQAAEDGFLGITIKGKLQPFTFRDSEGVLHHTFKVKALRVSDY